SLPITGSTCEVMAMPESTWSATPCASRPRYEGAVGRHHRPRIDRAASRACPDGAESGHEVVCPPKQSRWTARPGRERHRNRPGGVLLVEVRPGRDFESFLDAPRVPARDAWRGPRRNGVGGEAVLSSPCTSRRGA